MPSIRFILASASPRRRELLRQMGCAFKVVPSDAAEVSHEHLSAAETAQINAARKAAAVARLHPRALVMGVDTVVALDGVIYGKPRDLADARRMLAALSGRTHEVVSGVCLIRHAACRRVLFAERTEVTFRRLSAAGIEAYLAKTNPLDKAGAYGIQDHGEDIVRKIRGSFANVMGLPVERLLAELPDWGVPVNR